MIEALADVMVMKGVPEHIRSDNGPVFVARDLRMWLASTGTKMLYIEPGSPWENGYCESFNTKLRDEFLNGELFYSLKEIRLLARPLQNGQVALLAGLPPASTTGLGTHEIGGCLNTAITPLH